MPSVTALSQCGLLTVLLLLLHPLGIAGQVRDWQTALGEASPTQELPPLRDFSDLTECEAEYSFPDSIALVSEARERPQRGPLMWAWIPPGSANQSPTWSRLEGPTVPDTVRVRVLGVACDWNLQRAGRGSSRGDVRQVLIELDGFVFGIEAMELRPPGSLSEDSFMAHWIGSDGSIEAGSLQSEGPGAFSFGPYDRTGILEGREREEEARELRRDSIQLIVDSIQAEATQRRQARVDRERKEADREAEERDAHIWSFAQRQEWSAARTEAVLAGEIQVGMDKDMVVLAWGTPDDINRLETAGGLREQWVYAGGRYVYFENGVVVAIQS